MMIWQYKVLLNEAGKPATLAKLNIRLSQVSIIVKVTREVENQTLKCHRYWPDPESEPPQKKVTIGKIEIEHLSSKSQEQFIVRKFKLRHGQSERDITQFSYEAWPGVPVLSSKCAVHLYETLKEFLPRWVDHGVPLTAREFLDFRACIKAEEVSGEIFFVPADTFDSDTSACTRQKPRRRQLLCTVVLGSGVQARTLWLTGTWHRVCNPPTNCGSHRSFRVLECVENGVKSSDLDLDKAIRNLRERRPLMVQTVAQYKFCYDSVLSGIRRELEKFKDAQATPVRKLYILVTSAIANDLLFSVERKRKSSLRQTRRLHKKQTEKKMMTSGRL